MSWSLSIPSTPAAEFDAAVDAAEIPHALYADSVEETLQQLDAAKTAAKALVASAALGDETRRYGANLSGHANHDHAPTSGGSNDTISVNVYQALAPSGE